MAQDIAVPERRASELFGITQGRLRSWDDKGIAQPAIRRKFNNRWVVQYDYYGLLEIMVADHVTQRGISIRRLRNFLNQLHAEGYGRPITELTFGLHERTLYVKREDGLWTCDRNIQQIVIPEVVPIEKFEARILALVEGNRGEDEGRIEKRLRVQSSNAVFKGTRIQVSAVEGFIRAGYDDSEILEAYPTLGVGDIEAVRQRAS